MVKLVRGFETLPSSNIDALDSLTAAHIIHYNMATFNHDQDHQALEMIIPSILSKKQCSRLWR